MLEITLKSVGASGGGIFLPVDYRGGFLSIVKRAISSESSIEYDLIFGRRSVKPYTFAVTFGEEIKVEDDKIFFTRPIEFKFSSFEPKYEIYVYNYFVKNKSIEIYGHSFEVSSIKLKRKKEISEPKALFKTLSPVLIRSHENEKFYLCPKCENFDGDADFDEALKFNLREQVSNLLCKSFNGEVKLEPVNLRRVIVKHMINRGALKMPGFTGLFYLYAEPEILNLVNLAGLGSRRGQGFGMIDIV